MEQKVIQIGNSVGVVFPQSLQRDDPVKVGEKVIVERDPISKAYVIRKIGSSPRSRITPEFLDIVGRVNKRYGKALQELAGK